MKLEIRIMLVEDNLEDAAVTKRVLKHNKLDKGLVIATSGKEALAALQNKSTADLPQLILLDINLPDISGIDLLTSIKKDSNLCDIPVVILTGSNEDQDIQKSYDLGAGSYLVKPISNDALMLVIEKLFYPWGQTPGYGKIAHIIPAGVYRRLQDHGQVPESRMSENCAKTLLAYLPQPNMLMSVQMPSKGAATIVEVYEQKPFQADAVPKLIKSILQG